MCLACLEYIKGNLKLNEFKGAVGEIVRDGGDEHTRKIEEALLNIPDNESELKNKLKSINPGA